jgi:translocation and assembly module TamB
VSSVSDDNKTAEKRQNTSNLNRRIITGILKSSLVLIIGISFLMVFLLTPWGSKTVINTANSLVDELTIDYHSGGVSSELHLSSVAWQHPASKVDVYNLRLSFKLSCVLRFALCIDSLSTDKIVVQVQPKQLSTSPEPVTSAFTLPFPFLIENFSFNKFSLKVQNTADITWQKLSGKLDFNQDLRLDKVYLDGFNLKTYALDKTTLLAQPEPFDWATWQYQPMTSLPILLPMSFNVLAFDMSRTRLQLAGQEAVKLSKVSLIAKGTKKKVQLDELQIVHEQGRLIAKGNMQLSGDFEHDFSVEANAQLAEQPPLKLTLRSLGNIHSLSTKVELIETTLSAKTPVVASKAKPLTLAIDMTTQLSKAILPVRMKLSWRCLQWPLTESEVMSDKGVVEINGDLNALKMTVQTIIAGTNVPNTKVTLSAIAASTAKSKSFELKELLLETLSGQVLSKGELTFSEFINWQGSSVINNLNPGVFWPEWVADINGEVSTQANNRQGIWDAKLSKLDIKGQWQGYPLSMTGNVDFHQNNGLQLQALSLENAENSLLLNGEISKQQQLDIEFMLNAADLSKTLPQLGGALKLAGNLRGSSEQPEASYELSGSQLIFSDISIQQAVGNGNIKWNEQKPVELNLQLMGIQGVNNQVDKAQIVLIGDASNHQLDLTTSGQNTSVNLSIQGQLNQTSWEGNWLSGDIESSYANLTLRDPFKMEADWTKQQYLIAPHCWGHDNNELCIKLAEFKENILAWDLSLKEFDVLSVVRRLIPSMSEIQTKSRLNLELSGDWDMEQLPNANLNASLSPADWVFKEQNNLKLTLDETLVNAQITQNNILANINLSGNKIGVLSTSLEGQSGVYDDPLTRPIRGELLIERFDLAAFKALLPQLDVLQGEINGQALIDGTLGSPLLTGELTLAKGELKDESLPVALSAIEQSIKLKGKSADFKGSYKLGKGQGEMFGDIAWIPTLKGNLHLSGEELEFDYQSMIKAKVSPNISLMFEPNNLEINGEVTIPYARVKVRELPKGSISPSKDVILVEKQAELDASQQRLALNVLLNVDPLSSNNVKLDAFGLTTDLQGELRLQNNKIEIFGNGEVQLVNGRYRAYGQNLIIREGDILFTSSLARPFLNIEAVRDPVLTSDSVIAGLRVEGVAQNPKISVFSEPVMEQQQILSYMLTGRGMGESSGDSQDTILTNALLSLGLGQSENLISKVGNKLGFEDVNIETSGQGDSTQLSLTGTIAPGVQLRYGVGVFDSISEVAIRYELIPKLYIEAISGVSTAIEIYYQFSIEGSQNQRANDD